MKMDKGLLVKTTTILAFIFFFSGFSSLIYQVVWQRILSMHYGVGAISMTLIVSIYMFGLGVGALLGGYLAERVKKKIRFYFFVELLIGVFGILSLPFLDFLGKYTAGTSYPFVTLYVFLFLSIPTLLMGITLPLLTKIFNRNIKNFLKSVSYLYFINTLGAAFGALASSYIIISLFGLDIGIYIAVVINLILALMIFMVSRRKSEVKEVGNNEDINLANDSPLNVKLIYVLVFFTGFLAIGYEIIWFRVVGIFVKSSPYVFSTVLAVYLLGIAIGSFYMNRLIQRKKIDRKNVFFILQFMIGIVVLLLFLGYYYLTKYTVFEELTRVSFTFIDHPYPRFPSSYAIKDILLALYNIFDIVFWAGFFVIIPTLLMGASFPLITSLAFNVPDKEGITTGNVYFSNIVGNVLGGVITGFILLPLLSTEKTVLIFIIIGLLFGLFITRFKSKAVSLVARISTVVIFVVISILLLPQPGNLYKLIHTEPVGGFETYLEEDIDGIVVTYKKSDTLANYINGIAHGWRPIYSYHYEAGEAIMYSEKVENVLIIGYGNGTISEIALNMPTLKELTVIEINHSLINNLNKIPFFENMLQDERLNLIMDDGRRYLLNDTKKYDLIMIDPLRVRTSYSNNLYSDFFFKLLGSHLTDEGVIMVWINEQYVMPKTIVSAFDYVLKYKFFCLASNSPFNRNPELEEVFFGSLTDEETKGYYSYDGSYVGDQEYIKEDTKNYPINRDYKPICEYYLGLKVREHFMK